ncbi:MAG: carbon-phosphorus lyase complex subunit PhnI, partial [Sedimenticola sp.]
MYVAVKGGEQAIENSKRLLAETRRGDTGIEEISLQQIDEQLGLAVDRVMTEGSLYNRELAALAVKQAQGDLVEAIFLLRAYRTTLPRFGASEPLDTAKMSVQRRISSTFKDLPGGQVLGPSYDYTHRLLDFTLAEKRSQGEEPAPRGETMDEVMPRVVDLLNTEGLVEQESPGEASEPVADLTRDPITFPAGRDMRLQSLARADEGFLLALGYSTQR